MNKTIFICAVSVWALVGCGGGGGGDGSTGSSSSPNAVYVTSGGLEWSAPSDAMYVNPSLSYSLNTSDTTAQAYCTKQTCDANGSNCAPANFNHEAGWRLPTLPELQTLYASGAIPSAWNRSDTWTSTQGLAVNLGTGGTTITGSDTTKYRVSCVKPA